MPIIDIQLVVKDKSVDTTGLAQSMVNEIGNILQAPSGKVWLRWHTLPSSHYAENNCTLSEDELPVFVTVLHAHLPKDLAEETKKLSQTIATCLGRSHERVHIEYTAAGAGRIAFGGVLIK